MQIKGVYKNHDRAKNCTKDLSLIHEIKFQPGICLASFPSPYALPSRSLQRFPGYRSVRVHRRSPFRNHLLLSVDKNRRHRIKIAHFGCSKLRKSNLTTMLDQRK
jgi:hypothetical protein